MCGETAWTSDRLTIHFFTLQHSSVFPSAHQNRTEVSECLTCEPDAWLSFGGVMMCSSLQQEEILWKVEKVEIHLQSGSIRR